MRRPDAGNVRLETQTSLLPPKLKASPNLPNAHGPLEVATDRPGLPLAQRHARPKQTYSWPMVLALWHAFKCLGRDCSSLKSIFLPWASNTWKHLAIFGTMPPLNKFAMLSIEPSTAHSGPSSKSALETTSCTPTCLPTPLQPVKRGLSRSSTFGNVSSIWRNHLSPTMLSKSRVNFCEPLEQQIWLVSVCRAFRGLTESRAQFVILSVSFVGDFDGV
jgi:hypothetical protein